MLKFIRWLLPRNVREIRARWEREQIARKLGLFGAGPSKIVHDVTAKLHVVETDDMGFGNLGAPGSRYYEDQSASVFDKEYARMQTRTKKHLQNLPPLNR